jgi:hypothetical protein
MVHIELDHKGEALGEQVVQFFRGLDRGICETCGKLRGRATQRCSRCRTRTLARAVTEGDVVSRQTVGGVARTEGDAAAIAVDKSQRLRPGQLVHAIVDGISEVMMSVGTDASAIYIYRYIYIYI